MNSKDGGLEIRIKVTKDGPYQVTGVSLIQTEIIVTDEQGESVDWADGQRFPEKERCGLCRCGASKNKPYCDGMHTSIGFDGTETASREPYLEEAGTLRGPDLILTDLLDLCADARFCHVGGKIWHLTKTSDDAEAKALAIREAQLCPSGRLIAWDKATELPLEPEHEKSISLVEDPIKGVSGPIWVKGGIQIESADGFEYEVRNHATLCRCGRSANMPFCDGKHVDCGFVAEY